MPQLTGAVLVEVVGQDVLTWRLLQDDRQYILYSIDCTTVSAVLLADAEGPIEPTVLVAGGKTIVEFKKRSPFYTMLYRRAGLIGTVEGQEFYSDSWRFDYRRIHAWLFPRHAVIADLAPPDLQRHLGQWHEQPLLRLITPALVIEARYRIDPDGFTAAALPAAEPPALPEIIAQLELPDPAAIDWLRQVLAGAAAVGPLLAGSTWLGPLILGAVAEPPAVAPAAPAPASPPAPTPPAGRRRHTQL